MSASMAEQAAPSFTKAMLDEVLGSILSEPCNPEYIVVSPYGRAVCVIAGRAQAEQWNWRRTKRELHRIGRKSARREYHKPN